jgi:hypothetical protein
LIRRAQFLKRAFILGLFLVPVSALTQNQVEDIINDSNQIPMEDFSITFKKNDRTTVPDVQDPFNLLKKNDSVNEDDQVDEDPYRVVNMEVEYVRGSAGYEADFVALDADSKTFRLKSKGTRMRFLLNPGRYRIRTRSFDIQERVGSWSRWHDFSVSFKQPKKVYPSDGTVIKPVSFTTEKLFFEWPIAPNAVGYLLEVRTHDGELIKRKVVKKFYQSLRLPIDKTYRWAVLPLAFEGEEVNHPELKAIHAFRISQPVAETTPIVIMADSPNDDLDVKYEYEFTKYIGNKKVSDPLRFQAPTSEFRARFESGEFSVRVRSIYRAKVKSAWSAPRKFFIQLNTASIKDPKPNEIVRTETEPVTPVEISWFPVAQADRYILFVFDKNGQLVDRVETKQTKTVLQLLHDSNYQASVQSYLPNEKERDPPLASQSTLSFKTDAYVNPLFGKAEDLAEFYGRVGWTSSVVKYSSFNYDNNAQTTNNIFGDTGEASLGIWLKNSNWGGLGFVELTGIDIASQKYSYSNYGLQTGKRYILEDGNRAILWGGYSRKNLPELITRPLTTFLEIKSIQTDGIYLQGNYMRPWTKNFELLFSANFFYSLGNANTPSGSSLESLQSGNAGVYVSRALGRDYRGRLGYSYRYDSSLYASSQPGFSNKVDTSGHFISLIFEFLISRPSDF